MQTTIELTSRAVRLVRVEQECIIALESWPVVVGNDPIQTLAKAGLPADLGPVRVLMHSEDMLIRPAVMPAMPRERLARMMEAELSDVLEQRQDGGAVSGFRTAILPGDSVRVLAVVARERLVEQLEAVLVPQGARLAALSHPAYGLFHAWRRQQADPRGDVCLLDVGGATVHIALVRGGELIYARTQAPGLDDLAAQLALAKGVDVQTATRAVWKPEPEDRALADLVAAQAGNVAQAVTAASRFAATTLALRDFEPTALFVAGSGATTQHFADHLSRRARIPVRMMNPFADLHLMVETPRLDLFAALPSPWAACLGAACAETLELDALQAVRAARIDHWRTVGSLRLAAAAAVFLGLSAVALSEWTLAEATAQHQTIAAQLPELRRDLARHTQAVTEAKADAQRLSWLIGERRGDRIAEELLAAAERLQDAKTCPVVVSGLKLSREGAATVIELSAAATAGQVGAGNAANAFEIGLRRLYPPISTIEALPQRNTPERLMLGFRIVVADTAPGG